ncbi:MAG: division/cell wall cluster transcriptional repressor MraZ [Synergistales bacterium]|nr:division/cell wall cluster transcriptional repressor MraZ [Synergistales bacterium]
MLVGTYEHRIDAKGRIVLPARFRQELGEDVVATMGMDRCVAVYSEENWNNLLARLQSTSFSRGRSREFRRVLLATANEIQVDTAGRILVPQLLRNHGQLDKEVHVIGQGEHIELWNKQLWLSYRDTVMEDFADIVEGIDGF